MKDEKDSSSFASFDDDITSQDGSDEEGSEHDVTLKPEGPTAQVQYRQHFDERSDPKYKPTRGKLHSMKLRKRTGKRYSRWDSWN